MKRGIFQVEVFQYKGSPDGEVGCLGSVLCVPGGLFVLSMVHDHGHLSKKDIMHGYIQCQDVAIQGTNCFRGSTTGAQLPLLPSLHVYSSSKNTTLTSVRSSSVSHVIVTSSRRYRVILPVTLSSSPRPLRSAPPKAFLIRCVAALESPSYAQEPFARLPVPGMSSMGYGRGSVVVMPDSVAAASLLMSGCLGCARYPAMRTVASSDEMRSQTAIS